MTLDLNNSKNVFSFVEQLKETLKNKFENRLLQYLVNNAGGGIYKMLTEISEDEIDLLYQMHYKNPVLLTQKCLPIINDGGAIINIFTAVKRVSTPSLSTYAAMKSAIETHTRYLAKELGHRRILANVIALGPIATDFGGGRNRDNKDLSTNIAKVTSLGRIGEPNDLAGIIAFLCSDDSYWVNAQRIEVSGGIAL